MYIGACIFFTRSQAQLQQLITCLYLFRDGQLVPSSTMVALVKDAILKDENNRFLLDGFPRSTDNLEAWFKDFSDDEVQV